MARLPALNLAGQAILLRKRAIPQWVQQDRPEGPDPGNHLFSLFSDRDCRFGPIGVLLPCLQASEQPMGSQLPVAVIGAGPYGLSAAAHLAAAGLRPRVFGRAMNTWRSFMPNGMVLKSEGFAMNISDPDRAYPLAAFCAEQGIPYRDVGWPVPVEVFGAYGAAFARRFVPQLEETEVDAVARAGDGFRLTLATGERVEAREVVLATGIRPYWRSAAVLKDMPADRVSHSANEGDMARFRGRRVAVLGGGASAMDVAAALHRRGATAIAITHYPEVRFYPPGGFRDRFLSPLTPLGPGWKKQLCVRFPDLFHALPKRLRMQLITNFLGPAPAWSVRELIEQHVDLRLNTTVLAAKPEGDGVSLSLRGPSGPETLAVDHVVAATGYSFGVERLAFLEPALRAELGRDGDALSLNGGFESRVPGLSVLGTPSSPSFGPLVRFVCGTDFASRRLTAAIARREARRRPIAPAARPAGVMPLSEA